MFTHLFENINWIDLALAILLIRMILVGVKNGFVSEFFKSIGVVAAVFVSLHFYSYLAAWAAEKTKFTWDYWDLLMFLGLWLSVTFFFRFLTEGILVLFRVETNHQGFDQYAAGIVAVARGILVCSLTIFLILLAHNVPVTRMTLNSYSYKIVGHAGLSTYSFLYYNLVDKLFAGEHYNAAVAHVLHPVGHWSNER